MKMFKIVSAAMIGNALESYDLIVYGLIAPTIAIHFFPQQNKVAGIASTFAVFFIGYFVRPLGALFFGRIGDTIGRKPALLGSIVLMGMSTFGIGLLPDYKMIGVWAPCYY